MDLPQSLKQAIEERAQAQKREALTGAARAMSERYRQENVNGAHVVTDAVSALAYAASRMPATYGAVSEALSAALALIPADKLPRTLLDVGAGTGAAAWAAARLLPLERAVCLERESAMRETGRALMGESGEAALERADWRAFDLTKDALSDRAELVTTAYVLNELGANDRPAALKKLWDAAEGILVIVEPGTPQAFRRLLADRALLLGWGAHVLSPCPGGGDCPLPQDDWCHFTCRVARSRLHKALKDGDAPYEDEKFSYLAVSREAFAPAANRVLRHPQIEPGRILVKTCEPGGIFERQYRKKDGAAFRAARKTASGQVLEWNEGKETV